MKNFDFVRWTFAVLLFLLINSCVSVYREDDGYSAGEPAAKTDATPPIDYNPTFILSTSPYNEKIHTSPKIEVSTIDNRELSSVKFKIHLIDSSQVYLSGASASQFKKIWCEVVDTFDGKPRIIKDFKVTETTENSDKKIAMAIVMDHSGSMGESRAVVVQQAIENIIRNKSDNDFMALVRYDSRVNVESALTSNKQELLNRHKVNGLDGFGGMTAITDAIDAASKLLVGVPRSTEKVIVVFTDGWDNSSKIHQDSVVKFARANNIMIYGVDFGENVNTNFMKKFSDSTAGFYKRIYRTNEFPLVFSDIYKRLRNYYLVEYKTNNYGLHKVRLKLCMPNENLIAVTSYDNTPDIGSIGLINVYFDFNKATVTKDSESAINDVVSFMQIYPNMKIQLEGHTDSLNSTNDPDYNLKLSQKRADAVRDLMVKKGVPANRVSSIGYGERFPIAENNTEEGRAKNRRTEFVIISK